MLVIVLIIWAGATVEFMYLKDHECDKCYIRNDENLTIARIGYGLVIFGCVLACIQFAIFC